MKDWAKPIDEAIRSGHIALARKSLVLCRFQDLAREDVSVYAALCRRAGLSDYAVKALHSFVRPSEKKNKQASAIEKAEYSAALVRLGAIEEALALLETVDPAKTPVALLYSAFAQMQVWDYRRAASTLERFLASPGLDPYQNQVARVNLAAARVFLDERRESEKLLRELLNETEMQKQKLLHSNCLELSAQLAVSQADYDSGRHFLARAKELLQPDRSFRDVLWIEKWQTIIALKTGEVEARKRLRGLRELAREQKDSETLRDCDYYEGSEQERALLLLKVYFGTPHRSYRLRIREKLAQMGKQVPPRWNSSKGSCLDPEELFKPGQSLSRLFNVLSSDSYRPQTVVSIHSKTFLGEYYNPYSSPDRVHQLLKRLRKFLREKQTGWGISETKGNYALVADGSQGIVYRDNALQGSSPVSRDRSLLVRLSERFGDDAFQARQFSVLFGYRHANSARVLSELVQGGGLMKTGAGRGTRYRLFIV